MTHPRHPYLDHPGPIPFAHRGGAADANPIIFVHGWPEMSLSWRHQLPCFAAHAIEPEEIADARRSREMVNQFCRIRRRAKPDNGLVSFGNFGQSTGRDVE